MKFRFALPGLVLVSMALLTGCPVQPTSCSSTIEFDTAKYCAAGVQPVPGANGATQETTISASVVTDAHSTTLQFGATLTAGTHGLGGVDWSFTETSTGALDGFSVGNVALSAEPSHSLTFRYVYGANGGSDFLSATVGTLRIAKLQLGPADASGVQEVTRLSATFEVVTEHGSTTGAVSIGHD